MIGVLAEPGGVRRTQGSAVAGAGAKGACGTSLPSLFTTAGHR